MGRGLLSDQKVTSENSPDQLTQCENIRRGRSASFSNDSEVLAHWLREMRVGGRGGLRIPDPEAHTAFRSTLPARERDRPESQ